MTALTATLKHARYVIGENVVTGGAFCLFVLIVLTALVGPSLVPFDPLASDTAAAMRPPSTRHWFGTDQLGRDVFSRVIVATRLDLTIAVLSVVLVFLMGGLAGVAAGFFGGWTDRIVGRIGDTIMAFPLFVLAMGIVAALGNTVQNIVIATAIVNFPLYARIARSEANIRRDAGFVQAARLSGNSETRILLTQVLPNIMPIMIVQMSLTMGYAILNAAGLSFIGLGVRPPTAEWGIMVAEGGGVHGLRRVVERVLPRAGAHDGCILLQPARRRHARHIRSAKAHLTMQKALDTTAAPAPSQQTGVPLLEVRDLTVEFATRRGTITAVRDVNLTVAKGEVVGIVGESGSGKSVTSYAVMRILDRAGRIAHGSVMFSGLDIVAAAETDMQDLRGREMSMIFQNPRAALNPIRQVGRQIEDVLKRHARASSTDARRKAVDALERVRIANPAERYHAYPFELSGGMCQRIVIALALACRPQLLIADEPTTGLDVTTQKAVMELVVELTRERGMSTILITHDLGLAAAYCDRVVVMEKGRVVETARSEAIFRTPEHAYTRKLMRATPRPGSSLRSLLPEGDLTPTPGAEPARRKRCRRRP